jgi:hypothetical protein
MHLGVDGGPNTDAFDITSLAPFGHIHMNSGVWHDPVQGTSGVIRFNQQLACFEQSVDGGDTFACLLTTGGTVTSVGVIGDTNLVGDVDFATLPSGFMVINDTGDASPLTWAVDTLGLSGLWGFPAQGFDLIPTCYNETFGSLTTWTVTHNLNTTNVIVQVYDSNAAQLFPDSITATDANTVTVTFNIAQAGDVVVMACENS